MEKFSKILILVFFVAFASKAQSSKSLQLVEFKTSAICSMCKERIERDMSLAKGVEQVVLNLDTKVVSIKYHSGKTNPAVLKSNISKIGYAADNVPADPKAYNRLPICCQKGGHD